MVVLTGRSQTLAVATDAIAKTEKKFIFFYYFQILWAFFNV